MLQVWLECNKISVIWFEIGNQRSVPGSWLEMYIKTIWWQTTDLHLSLLLNNINAWWTWIFLTTPCLTQWHLSNSSCCCLSIISTSLSFFLYFLHLFLIHDLSRKLRVLLLYPFNNQFVLCQPCFNQVGFWLGVQFIIELWWVNKCLDMLR